MTAFLAMPPAREIRGSVRVPASKSATNRAFVLAALSDVPVFLVHPLDSGDTRALLRCLAAMGARVAKREDGISVSGPLGVSDVRRTVLDAEDSGTAARFLAALAAATPGWFQVTGSPRLCERPMGELVAALRSLGAAIVETGAPGCLPLEIRGPSLRSGRVRIDATRSSQFLSALMLAGAAGGPLEIAAAGLPASAPYAALTADALRSFGHRVEGDGPWRVSRGGPALERYDTPGDFSSALPLLAAVGVCGGEVRLTGLEWPSVQADALALPVLERMGITVSAAGGALRASAARGGLRAVTVEASDFPDAVPALAALAAFADGESRFDGIAHLRWKESNRLTSLATVLEGAGAAASAAPDSLSVRGRAARPGGGFATLPTFRDHRIAMAAALLSLRLPGLLIEDPDCVSKSYPGFFRDLDGLCRR